MVPSTDGGIRPCAQPLGRISVKGWGRPLLLASIILVAGCATASESVVAPTPTPTSTPATAAPTPVVTSAPTPALVPPDDLELMALLPATLDGALPVEQGSLRGENWYDLNGSAWKALEPTFVGLGRTLSDASLAWRFFPNDRSFYAIRIRGASADQFAKGYLDAVNAEAPGSSSKALTLAGRMVTKIVSTDLADVQEFYYYPHGEILYEVAAPSDEVAANLLALLP